MELFLTAFVGLFVLVDPFGTTAVFLSLTKNMDKKETERIAIKAPIIALCLMITFSFIGTSLLTHMGVSIDALKVAGGLLLFVTAFRMIMGFHDPDQLEHEGSSVYKDRSDIAVFPLAIPLLSGPGVLTGSLMFMTHTHTISDISFVLLAMLSVQTISMLCLYNARRLNRILGKTGENIIGRIMGVLMAAMAVQFIAEGSQQLFNTVI